MDPFPKCSEDLSARLTELEAEAQALRSAADQNSANSQWLRSKIDRECSEAKDLTNVLADVCKRAAANPERFSLTPEELGRRQRFVDQVAQRLRVVEGQIAVREEPKKAKQVPEDGYRRAGIEDNQRFIDGEMHQQQEMIRQQDLQLGYIAEGAGDLRMIANMVGDELEEDGRRLNEMDNKMDVRQSELDNVVAKMRTFLKQKSTWLWTGCIILTIIVIVMIVWVFIV
jgi:chromosome segregation ATPase